MMRAAGCQPDRSYARVPFGADADAISGVTAPPVGAHDERHSPTHIQFCIQYSQNNHVGPVDLYRPIRNR